MPPPKLHRKMLKKEPWMEDDNEAMRIFRQWLNFRSIAWHKASEERVVKQFNSLVSKLLFKLRVNWMGIFLRLTRMADEYDFGIPPPPLT